MMTLLYGFDGHQGMRDCSRFRSGLRGGQRFGIKGSTLVIESVVTAKLCDLWRSKSGNIPEFRHNVEARQSPQGMPVCEMTATSSEQMQGARGKGNMRNLEKMKERGRSRGKDPGAVATVGLVVVPMGPMIPHGIHAGWSRNWVSSLEYQTAQLELSCCPFVGGESSLEIG